MKGLVIDEPWISLLLDGKKTWEMRSRHTQTRGRIALIRKGTGTVVGVADLVDSIGPLDGIAWRAHQERHGIPLAQQRATEAWNHAWVLQDVRRLVRPVSYRHPSGAVVWVRLGEGEVDAFQIQNSTQKSSLWTRSPSVPERTKFYMVDTQASSASLSELDLVPVAKDGSWFSPSLNRGGYRIGAKGDEHVVASYGEALRQLRLMAAPRWRRPNSKGNWGIVTGVGWKRVSMLQHATSSVKD